MTAPPRQPETDPGQDADDVDVVTDMDMENERVAQLLAHSLDVPVLAEAVERQEAADAADTLENLDEADAADVLVAMNDEAAASAIAEMETPLAVMVLEDMLEDDASYVGRLLGLMAPDDAADLLQAIPEALRERLLLALPVEMRRGLRRLAGYGEDTAAGLMTTDFVTLDIDMTVGTATDAIRMRALPDEQSDLPIVDETGVLVGHVSLRTLLISRADRELAEVADRKFRAIPADLDQEEVARTFERYDHSVLPVVDEVGHLLGIITVDDIIDIIREEHTEDAQKLVGAGAGEAVYSGLSVKFRGRFPWLVTSLFMTCAAAVVVLFFEELIRERPVVAFLMPVIAALVGNAGHQALAVTLRGIVLDEVRPERVRPLIIRELTVGILNGLVLGVLIAVIVGLLSFRIASASWSLGVVAGIALALSMASGTLAGSGIPLIMRRVGADPAQSSAIFLILVTDAVAFTTFLGLTYWLDSTV